MGLVSLHTRLVGLLSEAQSVRRTALDAEVTLAGGPVSCNALMGLAQRFAAILSTTIADAEGDDALKDYAAAQFTGQTWVPLDLQIAGVKALLQSAIAAIRSVLPQNIDGFILKDKILEDGTVTVTTLTPEQTAPVQAVMTAIRSAIPE